MNRISNSGKTNRSSSFFVTFCSKKVHPFLILITSIFFINPGLQVSALTPDNNRADVKFLEGISSEKPSNFFINNNGGCIALASSNSPVCVGSTLNLYESGGYATSWSWTGPNGFTSNLQNPVILNATTANSGIYTVVISNGECSSSSNVIVSAEPIVVTDCPNDIVVCADSIKNNVFGAYVDWQSPDFDLNCLADLPGGLHNFIMLFDLPEVKWECWEFNQVQRVGINNGFVNLWQSTGSGDPSILSPTVYIEPSLDVIMDVYCETGRNFTWKLYLDNDSTEIFIGSVNINTPGLDTYTINIPATIEKGLYRLKFVFSGNGNNKCYVDNIYFDAILMDLGNCIGGINFNITGPIPGFFPVGDSLVVYTATYTSPTGTSLTQTCEFHVNVQGVKAQISSIQNNTCSLNSGSITVSAQSSSASPKLEYSINGGTWISFETGSTQVTIGNLAVGSYLVNIRDTSLIGNCEIIQPLPATINGSSVEMAVSKNTVVPVSCTGSHDGSIDVTVSGGTAPFSYHWAGPSSFSSSSEDISGLAPGTYSLTVTDAYNCVKTLSENILESSYLLAVSATSVVPVSCKGSGDGSIDVTVSGGTAPFSYHWAGPGSFSSSSEDISGLAPGTYSLTVTDAYNCAKTLEANILESSALLAVSITSTTPVTCSGGGDGSINISVSGGTLPYVFVWSGPASYSASTEDISGLAPGTYYVTVTDAYKCAKTASAKVEQSPGMLTLSISTITPVSCTGSHDGSIDLSVSNGTLPYNYSWSGPGSYTASSEDISGLAPGTYYVTVTDAYGCIRYTSATILQSSALLAVSASSVVPVSCKGSGDGSIDVTVSGGTAPFSYHWSGPGSFSSSSEDISGLAPGAYNLTVTDAYNCSKTLEVEILEPELLTIQAEGSSQVSCYNTNDGVITVTANGGTGAYSFSLNGGPIQSSNVFNGLPSGTYSITVFDINNCSATTEALLNIINPPLLVISAVGSSQVSCHNSNDGVITATANGGTGAYSYSLNGGPNQSSNVFSNLPADTYIVTVYDINNCSASTPEIIINNPAILTLTAIASPQVSCYNASDGVITATATGGTGAYSYSLNGGAIQSSNVFSGLPAGTYIVTVYDIKGCSATAPQITIANPEGLKVMAKASFQVSCYNASDGEISATASGGTGAYKYSLNNGPAQLSNVFKGLSSGKYIVSVFDANNCSAATPEMIINNPPLLTAEAMISSQISCHDVNDGIITVTAMGGTGTFSYSLNGGPAQTSNVFSGLSEGTYNITVNDIYNCSAITEFPIVITNPSPITIVTTNSPQVSCHDASDGFITATVSGGTGSYSYSINGGPLQVSNEFTDLTSGTYVLTVFDANNCSAVSPSIVINNPAVLTIDASITSPVLCHDQSNGVINATAEGGTGIYSYSINEGPIQSSSVFSGLSSGTYVISVFDANNCKATSPEITLLNPQPLSASVAITSEVSCYNGSDGAILVSSSGGTAPYSYSLNGELPQESDVFSDLPAGNYVLTVYDNMGCSVEVQFELSQPDQIKIELVSVVDADCTGNLNGAIEISASGGESPYTYSWSNGSLTPMIEGLSAGNYTVTVTDNKGCQNEYTKQVNPGPVEEQLGFSNAFTPDGDGINDLWAIKNIELYPDNSLVVVNRWGNEIYSIKGYQGNWDGSQLTEGTYFYILKVEMCNVQRTFNGYITILR